MTTMLINGNTCVLAQQQILTGKSVVMKPIDMSYLNTDRMLMSINQRKNASKPKASETKLTLKNLHKINELTYTQRNQRISEWTKTINENCMYPCL